MGLVDFDSLLYGPVYDVLADAEAVITVDGLTEPQTVPAIDRTEGVEVSASGADWQTIKPAAVVRSSALTSVGIAARDVDGGSLTLNGKTWRITSHMLKPSPNGEAAGEVWLILAEAS